MANGSGLWSYTWLGVNDALPPDAVFVIFMWPSFRVSNIDPIDVEVKAWRAFVAGLLLAQFLQAASPQARICLFGQSFGGRAVLTTLHLLGGGALSTDLHVRCLVLATAVDDDWIVPGKKLGQALVACEGLLNLYNPTDDALVLYPLMLRGGHRRSLGRTGPSNRLLEQLGPLAGRYAEIDVEPILGPEHTLMEVTSNPRFARWITPYTWFPGPPPSRTPVEHRGIPSRPLLPARSLATRPGPSPPTDRIVPTAASAPAALGIH